MRDAEKLAALPELQPFLGGRQRSASPTFSNAKGRIGKK
jgi:hypothetical protein